MSFDSLLKQRNYVEISEGFTRGIDLFHHHSRLCMNSIILGFVVLLFSPASLLNVRDITIIFGLYATPGPYVNRCVGS